MKIKTITIHNWRSIKDVTIIFEDTMIFIGQNNHGKSNILSAVLFFLGQIGLDPLDFNGDSTELFVEISFGDLDENDKVTFKKYLTAENTIKVRKQAQKNGGFEYHGYLEIPEIDWLREDRISEFTKREIAETLPLAVLLPKSGRITVEAFRSAQEGFISAHHAKIKFRYEMELSPFLGAKNVAKGIFGDVYFLPSIKKASDELAVKGSCIFADLYARVINKMSQTNEDFKEAKTKIEKLISVLNRNNIDGTENPDRPAELTLFENSLKTELENWNTTIDVEVTPPNVDEIFRMGTSVWVNDGVRTDISRKGQGLQRALIFALIRTLAKVLKEERQATPGGETPSRQASKSAYYIFEEPELYLHPQAQRELYDSLVELSTAENQIILCTHSSSFLSLEKYKSICIVRKSSLAEGTIAFQCTENLFSDNQKQAFNMAYWINPDRSELFFAKKVLLVEGATDKTIIPYLADYLNVFRYDYTVIDCGSKTAMPSYIQLLNKFSVPYIVVYDRDHQDGKLPDAIAVADRNSQSIEQAINSSFGKSIIFENDIEEELGIVDGSTKNKPYLSLTHVKEPSFVLNDSLKEKIKAIYN
ncbi:AAA family ATPase [Candidatus Dojkabacteria bacterium]|nr:AAA family ATPase [Candidatus Dojkabacteria bacterium]